MFDVILGVLAMLAAAIVLVLLFVLHEESSWAEDPERADGRVTLSHGTASKAIAYIAAVAFTAGTVVAAIVTVSRGFNIGMLACTLICGLFLGLALNTVFEGRKTFVLDSVGIHHGARGRSTLTMSWEDVRSVDLSMLERVVIRDASGRSLKIGARMRGIGDLWSFLEQHVDPGIWSRANSWFRRRHGRRSGQEADPGANPPGHGGGQPAQRR